MPLTIMHKVLGLLFAGAFVPATLNVVSVNSKEEKKVEEKKEEVKEIDVNSQEFKKELEKYKDSFEDFQKEVKVWSQPIKSLLKASKPLIWLANPKNILSIINNNWGDQIIATWKEQTGAFKNLKVGEWVEVEEIKK